MADMTKVRDCMQDELLLAYLDGELSGDQRVDTTNDNAFDYSFE